MKQITRLVLLIFHFIQRGFPSAAAGGAGSELPGADE